MTKKELEHKRRLEMIDFAIAHGWIIDPGKGLEVHLANAIKFDRCPCDKTRPYCPCPESLEEVPVKGHCRCRLYFRDLVAYRKEMREK